MNRKAWLPVAALAIALAPAVTRAQEAPGRTTRPVKTFTMHKEAVLSLAFNPANPREFASGSAGLDDRDMTRVRFWDVNGKLLRTASPTFGPVSALAWSRDGLALLSGSDNQYDKYFTALRTPSRVLLWDPSRPRLIKFMDHGQFNGIHALAFSADGKQFAMSGANKHIEVWTHDVDVAKVVAGRILYGHLSHVPALAFAPAGSQLASGSMDATVRIWDPTKVTGQLLKTLTAHKGPVNAVAWAGEATVVSGGSDHTVRTWDVAAGKQKHVLNGHTACVNAVRATPDGRLALSVSNDGTLRVWDVASGKLLQTLPAHDGPVETLSLSADGKLALTGGVDTKVKLWSVGTYK